MSELSPFPGDFASYEAYLEVMRHFVCSDCGTTQEREPDAADSNEAWSEREAARGKLQGWFVPPLTPKGAANLTCFCPSCGPKRGMLVNYMLEAPSYLVAHGKQNAETFNVPFVTFAPALGREKPFIGVYEGFSANNSGGAVSPLFVLKTKWLMNILSQLDLGWFVAMIERMARGEVVQLSEVDAAFRSRNGHGMEFSIPPLSFSFMRHK
jgi:hypothetical protein